MKHKSAVLGIAAVLSGLMIVPRGWAQADNQPTGTQPAGVQAVDVQAGGKIARVTIQGNKNIPTQTIQAVLTEKVGDEFDPQATEKDREAIAALGYWAGPVQFAYLTDTNGKLDLTFTVIENPVVKAIQFNANTLSGQPSIPATTLLAQMQTTPGQVLNTNTLQRDLDALFNPDTGYVRRQGYRFNAGAGVSLDPSTQVLIIPVIENYVQAVLVNGSGKVSVEDVLRQFPIKQGDLYNDNTVRQAVAALDSTARFGTVGPVTVGPTVPGRVTLTLSVTGKK